MLWLLPWLFQLFQTNLVTDITNKEQVTLLMQCITENYEVQEKFLGLHAIPSIDAVTLFLLSKTQ